MHVKYISPLLLTTFIRINYTKLFLFMAVGTMMTIMSCKQEKKMKAHSDAFYTCSMHPQVREPKPGKCPICSMELIRVEKNSSLKSGEIQLSEQQIQLGNIIVDTIEKAVMGNETILTATLNYDQQKLTAVSSRVMGRVEKLYHKIIGEYIKKGDPLMEVYSEVLNNAKQEYLLALERRRELDNAIIDFTQIINGAKTKLRLWGMTEGQVLSLEKNKNASTTTTFYSSESGYITELNVQEGEYVSEGGLIVQLADLSTLWAEAQVYTSQFSQLNVSDNVIVRLPDLNIEITGKFTFVNPEVSPDKRINLIRVTIPNARNTLRPGMSAYVILKGSHQNVMSLPIDAVIRDGSGASVWIQTGKNIFTNKMVSVGMESGDRIEITGGISQEDAVVIRGAYLINSEYIFKNGGSAMGGMKM